jgi:tetratricopeptide (TPR) repeat protein
MTQRGSWLIPIVVVLVVAAGVWWFVFRPSREERGKELLSRAGEAMQKRDYAAAERDLKAAIELVPANAVLWHNLGILYLGQQRLSEARSAFQRAAAACGPQDAQMRADELFQIASISYSEKKWPQAAQEMEQALAADPQRPHLHARLMDLQLRRLKDSAAADSSTARFLRLCGRTAGNLEAAAYVFYQNEHWPRAEALAREAIALADSQTSAHALVARALWRQGTARDGLRYVESARERYPRAAALWVAQGAIQLDVGLRSAALAAADRAVELAPDDVDAHDLRRHALSSVGRNEDALREIEVVRRLTQDAGRLQALKRDEARLRSFMRATTGGARARGGAPADSAAGGGPPP